jgi:hypothetical protein
LVDQVFKLHSSDRNIVEKERAMANQKIFMDTEFTSFHELELISIGLAASTGQEFYAEVPYDSRKCSDFVKETVIPLLGQEKTTAYKDLQKELLNWFRAIRTETTVNLFYDSEFDKRLFLDIFNGDAPKFVNHKQIGRRNISELLRKHYCASSCLPEHHALNDARALRYAFLGRPGRAM